MVATHTSDGTKRKVTDTDTTNRNSARKLLINRIIPVIITPIDQKIVDGVASSKGTLRAHQEISSMDIVTNTICSGVHVFQELAVVNRKYKDRTISRDRNTSRISPRLLSLVRIGGGTSVSPDRTGSQEIHTPSRTIGPVEVRNAQPFHTSINGNYSINRYLEPTFSTLISHAFSEKSNA